MSLLLLLSKGIFIFDEYEPILTNPCAFPDDRFVGFTTLLASGRSQSTSRLHITKVVTFYYTTNDYFYPRVTTYTVYEL